MVLAGILIDETFAWLRANYSQLRFFVERDMVWTIQTHLAAEIGRRGLPYRVFNDFPMLPGNRRSLCVDLALVDESDRVIVAVEFKYEPSHRRSDIWPTKFPVIGWIDVAKDIERIHTFVTAGKCRTALAIVVDEGGFFRHRPSVAPGKWVDWEQDERRNTSVAVHITRTSAIESSIVG